MKKWIWALGFLPLILDYIATYMPSKYIPELVKSILDNGGNWIVTIVFVSFFFVISSYLVYIEIEKDKQYIQNRLDSIENLAPNINVGLKDINGNFTEEFVVRLKKIPPYPNFDEIIDDKRNQLLSKKQTNTSNRLFKNDVSRIRSDFGSLTDTLASEPNPEYENEIDEYLINYRKFLLTKFEFELDRSFSFSPIVVNTGGSPATDVTIEIIMPHQYNKPDVHQSFDRREKDEYAFLLESEPRKPKPTINPFFDLILTPNILSESAPVLDDLDEPFIEYRNGKWIITYTVNKLVPQYYEDEFAPFWIWVTHNVKSLIWDLKVKIYSSELREPQERNITIEFVIEN